MMFPHGKGALCAASWGIYIGAAEEKTTRPPKVAARRPKTAARPKGTPSDSALKLYTIKAGAAKVGISRTTLHELLDRGDVGYVYVNSNRRIPESELHAWIERNLVKATK